MSRDSSSKVSSSKDIGDGRDSVDRFLETALPLFPSLDPETEAAVDRMTKLVKHIDHVTEHTVSAFGLNTGEFRLLLKLRKTPDGRMGAGALAKQLSLSSGAMTNRLDRLEEHGYIARERQPDDRRGVTVAITETGIDVVTRAVAAQAVKEREILEALPAADRRRLNDLLRTLVLAVESADHSH
jgi:DNA-binding MarR family transcriptional regulator